MGFEPINAFRMNVVMRVMLVALMLLVCFWSLVNTDWQVIPVVCGLAAVLLTWNLIVYAERTNREFASFLEFIHHHDYSVNISNYAKGASFAQLAEAYRRITREFRRLNRERAAHERFLESLFAHVNVALVCFDEAGNVRFLNRQATLLFKLPYVPTLKSLHRFDERMPAILAEVADGERRLVSIDTADEPLQLSLYSTHFQILEQPYRLVSMQNIRDELEQREVDSWQKLIRVLTHEIMNSITPIISLAKVVKDMVGPEGAGSAALAGMRDEDRSDLLRSILSIESRSSGLIGFVRAYSDIANIPAPSFSEVNLQDFLERVRTMMLPSLHGTNVALNVSCVNPGLRVNADPQQLEQVLINLIKNAIEALDDRAGGTIELRVRSGPQNRVFLQVSDNGPGIDPGNLDNIFVPFFTTKRRGSGVGLSISRQIMLLNKGTLTVKSVPGEGCTFTLGFR